MQSDVIVAGGPAGPTPTPEPRRGGIAERFDERTREIAAPPFRRPPIRSSFTPTDRRRFAQRARPLPPPEVDLTARSRRVVALEARLAFGFEP